MRKTLQILQWKLNKAECNYPTMENEILPVIRGIEKFLIFLAPKYFLL